MKILFNNNAAGHIFIKYTIQPQDFVRKDGSTFTDNIAVWSTGYEELLFNDNDYLTEHPTYRGTDEINVSTSDPIYVIICYKKNDRIVAQDLIPHRSIESIFVETEAPMSESMEEMRKMSSKNKRRFR